MIFSIFIYWNDLIEYFVKFSLDFHAGLCDTKMISNFLGQNFGFAINLYGFANFGVVVEEVGNVGVHN